MPGERSDRVTCPACGASFAQSVRFCGRCGASIARSGSEPRRIGRFVLGPAIGHGGMGVVHRARDTDLDRDVALKLISPSLANDPDFRLRFEAEARAAAAVDHPNVLPVFEAGEDEGELYLAMRLVEGTDLGAILSRQAPLTPHRAARIVAQTAAALDAAHERSLVHRDVKPANVLIDDGVGGRDHVYLTDFGLTQSIGGSGNLTVPGTVVGTANYLSPEQIEGRPIDGRVDVYALACVAFESLTGAPPFARDTVPATLEAHLHAEIPRATSRVAGLPPELDEAIGGGLAKRPADRFASCGAFAKALGTALGSGTGSIPRDPRVAAKARPRHPQADPPSPPSAATAVLEGAAPAPGRSGRGLLAGAFALVAIGALAAAAALLPPLLGERDDGADLAASRRIVAGAHAVNEDLSTLVSRLAADPLDADERERQLDRLPALDARAQALIAASRNSASDADRPLLVRSLRGQRRLLDQYRAVLRADPASAGPRIEEMLATLDRLERSLREAGPDS